jgi:hypothetical protein
MVNANDPAVCGVPLIVPPELPELSDKAVGKELFAASDHVTVPVPPELVRLAV